MVRWNTAGAFASPKGIRKNSKFPRKQQNAVFQIEFSAKGICQCPAFRSKVLKILLPPTVSKCPEFDAMNTRREHNEC